MILVLVVVAKNSKTVAGNRGTLQDRWYIIERQPNKLPFPLSVEASSYYSV